MENRVQLITYVDRLSDGGIAELQALLADRFAGLFGGVHLLPFYDPIDGADAGYDPSDHTRVDPRLGTWDDVKALGEVVPVMADLIANHISVNAPQFADFMRHGPHSQFAGLFLTRDAVFGEDPGEEELAKILRLRAEAPFTTVQPEVGPPQVLWTTFTSEQLDINVEHPVGRAYLDSILAAFARGGVAMIRLDAAGFAIKRAGTSCFMLPETYQFIGELAQAARQHGMESLVEVHGHYLEQIQVAQRVDRVYDFALPPLVLHAFYTGAGRPLQDWLKVSPRNALTVLDTHDGIGVIDAGPGADGQPGLISQPEVDELVEEIRRRSHGQSQQASGIAAKNVDDCQINCTFYDALGRDDTAYLIARAVQFFAPGIPQVYYMGLLAAGNDMALLARTGEGRDINRSRFTADAIDAACSRPVVQALMTLIQFRNEHPAFGGSLEVPDETPDTGLVLRWRNGEAWARLEVDFTAPRATITHGRTTKASNCLFVSAEGLLALGV